MTKRAIRNKPSSSQRHWQAHVRALQRSGLSRAEYCRHHDLSYRALGYWQRKLSRPRGPTLVPVAIGDRPGASGRAALRIVLPGRLAVEVGDNFSPATLTRLLATLEGR